ncbi:MAG: hypothetical protein J6V72_11765 [Kiritimatiellae bacterium]|nr:hypothetical protein [Kiritimatiellia bacterium]
MEIRKGMRKYDRTACALVIAVGLAWFAAAEIVYDGSLMENPFLRSGMLATWYVPPAAMYLVKCVSAEGRGSAVLAWLAAFGVMSAMVSVDVLVTHYKPDSDHCCIPVGTDFACSLLCSLIFTAIIAVSDSITMRWMRGCGQPVAKPWIVRRAMRLGGAVLFTVLFTLLMNGVFIVIGQVLRAFFR